MKFLVLPKIKYQKNIYNWPRTSKFIIIRDSFRYWAENYFILSSYDVAYYKITGLLMYNKKMIDISSNMYINLEEIS